MLLLLFNHCYFNDRLPAVLGAAEVEEELEAVDEARVDDEPLVGPVRQLDELGEGVERQDDAPADQV